MSASTDYSATEQAAEEARRDRESSRANESRRKAHRAALRLKDEELERERRELLLNKRKQRRMGQTPPKPRSSSPWSFRTRYVPGLADNAPGAMQLHCSVCFDAPAQIVIQAGSGGHIKAHCSGCVLPLGKMPAEEIARLRRLDDSTIPLGRKLCRMCEQTLDLASFWRDGSCRSGYAQDCKPCWKSRQTGNSKTQRAPIPDHLRSCTSCQAIFGLEAFPRLAVGTSRRSPLCSDCTTRFREALLSEVAVTKPIHPVFWLDIIDFIEGQDTPS